MTDLVGLGLALVGFALVAIVVDVFLRLWIKRERRSRRWR
jgi:hypothetical protein